MQFYLKASDKDLKQPLENPGDGIILCKSKDKDVVLKNPGVKRVIRGYDI